MDTITQTKPILFSEQTEYNQVILMRGIVEQLQTLSYPKLSACNHQLKNIGLKLVPIEELAKKKKGMEAKAKPAVGNPTDLINSVRLILVSDKSDADKVQLLQQKLITLITQ